MANYAIHFTDNDPHSPRNGAHAAQPSGAAILAEYGEGLSVEGWEAEECTDSAIIAAIDALPMGGRLVLLGDWGERVEVERVG